MNDQLRSENRSTLASIAATIAFPYLWLGSFIFLGWLYKIGFFGHSWGSWIVMGLLGLALITPATPLALTRFIARPLFSNLLGHDIVTHAGCVSGLISVVGAAIVAIYFLSRGVFGTAGVLMLAAPVVGTLLTGGVTLLSRGGGLRLFSPKRTSGAPRRPEISVTEAGAPRTLPGARKPPMLSVPERPALPTSSARPTRAPTPRRRPERPSRSAPPSRRPPPPRRK